MPRHLIANWKMQLDATQSAALAEQIARGWATEAADQPKVQMSLCPAFLALAGVSEKLNGTGIVLGAQDCFWEDKGAYTGGVSVAALKAAGCRLCIIGHSERRSHLGETDEMVNKKAIALLRGGLTPVICVGETREEREAGKRDAVVINQVNKALQGIQPLGTQQVIIAYEPRWVIGTGQAVEPEDAATMHRLIHETIHDRYASDVTERQFSIIYGGSADASNIAGFLKYEEIQGALVGGASLKPLDFLAMARTMADIV